MLEYLNNTQIYHVKSRHQEMAVYLEYISSVVIEIHQNGHKAFFTPCSRLNKTTFSIETEGLLYICLKIKTEINMKDN